MKKLTIAQVLRESNPSQFKKKMDDLKKQVEKNHTDYLDKTGKLVKDFQTKYPTSDTYTASKVDELTPAQEKYRVKGEPRPPKTSKQSEFRKSVIQAKRMIDAGKPQDEVIKKYGIAAVNAVNAENMFLQETDSTSPANNSDFEHKEDQGINALLDKYGVDSDWFINTVMATDNLTQEELQDLAYIEDRIRTHLDWQGTDTVIPPTDAMNYLRESKNSSTKLADIILEGWKPAKSEENGEEYTTPWIGKADTIQDFEEVLNSVPDTIKHIKVPINTNVFTTSADSKTIQPTGDWRKEVLQLVKRVSDQYTQEGSIVDSIEILSFFGVSPKEGGNDTDPIYIKINTGKKRDFDKSMSAGEFGSLD